MLLHGLFFGAAVGRVILFHVGVQGGLGGRHLHGLFASAQVPTLRCVNRIHFLFRNWT